MIAKQTGLTLIELMIAIVILAIVMAIAAPSMLEFRERKQLRGAAEALYSNLYYARSEALKKNSNIFVNFSAGNDGAWCVGLDDTAACNCNTANDCQIDAADKVVDGADYPAVDMTHDFTGNGTRFESRRGAANVTGTATFTIGSGDQRQVLVSVIGRVRYLD